MLRLRFYQFILLFLVFAVWACACPAAADDAGEAVPLWRSVPAPVVPEQFSTKDKPWILREQAIVFDSGLITLLKDAAARPHPPIHATFFDIKRAALQINSQVSRMNGSAIIRGLVAEPRRGDFTLVVNGNIVAGTFHIGPRLFKVEHVVNGHQRVIELDPDKMPPD